MIVALLSDSISDLGKEINLLKDRQVTLHEMTFKKISKQAWQTAIKAINNHRAKICEGVLQIFDTASKTTDVVVNAVVEKVFVTMSLHAILDLRSDCLKPLPDSTPFTKFACIWETDSSYRFGFSSISKADPGWNKPGSSRS